MDELMWRTVVQTRPRVASLRKPCCSQLQARMLCFSGMGVFSSGVRPHSNGQRIPSYCCERQSSNPRCSWLAILDGMHAMCCNPPVTPTSNRLRAIDIEAVLLHLPRPCKRGLPTTGEATQRPEMEHIIDVGLSNPSAAQAAFERGDKMRATWRLEAVENWDEKQLRFL